MCRVMNECFGFLGGHVCLGVVFIVCMGQSWVHIKNVHTDGTCMKVKVVLVFRVT